MIQTKKFITLICSCTLLTNQFIQIYAEEEDFSNTSYWNNLCTNTSSLTAEQQTSCSAYIQYVQQQNSSLQSKINDIDSSKEEISSNIAYYGSQIETYSTQISEMNDMINDLTSQIDEVSTQIDSKQVEIDLMQVQIDEKSNEVSELQEHVKNRMIQQQQSMKTNQIWDVIMGAKSFSNLVRIINGLNDITQYDNSVYEDLNTAITELNGLQDDLIVQQDELESLMTGLEQGKTALDAQQSDLLAAKYRADYIQQTYTEQLASVDSSIQNLQSEMNANSSAIGNIESSIENSIQAEKERQEAEEAARIAAEQAAQEAQNNAASDTTNTTENTETTDSSTSTDTSNTTDSSSSNQSSQTGPSAGDSSGNPYYGGWSNCTWGAWQLVHDTLGISLPRFAGNAGDWLNSAASLGYATGSTPTVYSIAVMPGHVSFVTQVNGDMIYVREGNYLGSYGERWIPVSRCLGFIYL